MAETVDVQAETIGVGSVIAFVLFGYGTFVRETIFGYEATTLGLWAFVATFATVALFHNTYGRRDIAAGHAVAALGLGLFLWASSPLPTVIGFLLLVGGGARIAMLTVRAGRTAEGS